MLAVHRQHGDSRRDPEPNANDINEAMLQAVKNAMLQMAAHSPQQAINLLLWLYASITLSHMFQQVNDELSAWVDKEVKALIDEMLNKQNCSKD